MKWFVALLLSWLPPSVLVAGAPQPLGLQGGEKAEPAAELSASKTLSFSGLGRRGSFPGSLSVKGQEIAVDLSFLPSKATVWRAILRVSRDPSSGHGGDESANVPIRIRAEAPATGTGGASKSGATKSGTSAPGASESEASTSGAAPPGHLLSLRPPRFLDFDATDSVRETLEAKRGSGPPAARFRVETFPGWMPGETRLDVSSSYRSADDPVTGATPLQGALDLKAWHDSGQTFLVWTGSRAYLPAESATLADLREAQGAARRGPEIRFRIYRSPAPITPLSVREAQLVDEVDAFTAFNGEFHGDPKPEDPVFRYVVREGEPPLAPECGVYVHRPDRAGKAWYAVVFARDGEEDFSSVRRGCAVGPVEETVGPGRPVLQRVEKPKEFMYVDGPTLEYYVRWEAHPTANLPSRPFDYLVATPPKPRAPAPLCVALHCWGGSLRGGYGWWYGARDGAMLLATNQIPYDWWASYHESLGTLRSFSEGVNRSFTPKRVWAFVEWMRTRWNLDASRVFVGGSSMGGAGVSHWIRYGDRFAYGISWVGVHIPALSPQFRGSYENAAGRLEWNCPHESGTPVFDHLDGARFLRENPAHETAFLAYSNGKNDSGIGWKQAVEFTRALQETRRPHLFVWGQGGHGQRAYFPTPEGGGDNVEGGLDIRVDRSLPAFTRCSLDDDLGDGDPERGAKEGQINQYLRWDAESVVDEADRWAAVVYLIADAPAGEATADVTPRRCRSFRPGPGAEVVWSCMSAAGGREVQTGKASADRWGLVTAEKLQVAKERRKIEIRKAR